MNSEQEGWLVYVRKRISSMLCDETPYKFHDFTRDLRREWADEGHQVTSDTACFLAYHGALAIQDAPDPQIAAMGLEQWIVNVIKSKR